MVRRIARFAAARAFIAVAWLASAGCSSITRDELRCEEAMSHLAECCAGIAASPVACVGTGGLPFIAFPDVECLVDMPCGEMQTRGVCQWAQTPTGDVCP